MGDVNKNFIAPLSEWFDIEAMSEASVKALKADLAEFCDADLEQAATFIRRNRTRRGFPLPAECIAACRSVEAARKGPAMASQAAPSVNRARSDVPLPPRDVATTQAWEAARVALEASLGPDVLATWPRTLARRNPDGSILIATKSRSDAIWLRSRFGDAISEALVAVTGDPRLTVLIEDRAEARGVLREAA